HRGQRGMTGVRIGHAGREADPARRQRARRQARVDVTEESLVREPEVVVAQRLRARGQRRELTRRTRRQEQEPGGELHGVSSPESASAIFSAVIGSVVILAPTAAATAFATAAGGSMLGGSPTPLAP